MKSDVKPLVSLETSSQKVDERLIGSRARVNLKQFRASLAEAT
jgi:hypothetical protein